MKLPTHIVFMIIALAYLAAEFLYFGGKYENMLIKDTSNVGLVIMHLLFPAVKALTYAYAVILLAWLFGHQIIPELERVARKTKNLWDDWFVEVANYLVLRGKWLLAAYVIFRNLIFSGETLETGNMIFKLLLGIFVLMSISYAIRRLFMGVLIKITKDRQIVEQLYPISKKLIIVIVWIIGLIFILDILGVEVTTLIAGAGIGGLAIALAAQKPLANLFGAFSLLLNKPFEVGQNIQVDGTFGKVQEIGLTYTELQDRFGQKVYISNEQIGSMKVENFKTRKQIRGEGVIGLTYNMSAAQMKKGVDIMKSIFEKFEKDGKIHDWRAHFESFGDFSQNIGYYFHDTTGKYMDFKDTQEAINFEIKTQFEKAGLEFAFPTQEVIVQNKK